jgi:DNA-binding transcriptional regulator YiaG
MSIVSELKRRSGPRVQTRAASSKQSNSGGAKVKLILRRPTTTPLTDAFEVARLLVRAGVPVRSAKRAIDGLLRGEIADIEISSTYDKETLKEAIQKEGIDTYEIRPREVNIKVLRSRLGVTQDTFAACYGLDVASVRNWEQGRTRPEGAAVALLNLIDRAPEKVVELLGASVHTESKLADDGECPLIDLSNYPLATSRYGFEKLVWFQAELRRERSLFRFGRDREN